MNAKEDAAELGLVDKEPRLEARGLVFLPSNVPDIMEIPEPGWNLSPHLSD